MIAGYVPYSKPSYEALYKSLSDRLELLNKILASKTFLVGERITLADVFVASSLNNAFTGVVDKATREKVPNVVRYFETVINQSKLAPIFDNGKPELTDAAPSPPSKPKADKPKAEAKPAEPKAPKAKAPKPAEDDDEPEADVPAEPKVKNPLDDLPKSAFNLEEWKRQYSNLETREEAIPWFYKK